MGVDILVHLWTHFLHVNVRGRKTHYDVEDDDEPSYACRDPFSEPIPCCIIYIYIKIFKCLGIVFHNIGYHMIIKYVQHLPVRSGAVRM